MNAGQHTRRAAARAGQSACRTCRNPRRPYATAAAAAAAPTPEDTLAQHIPPAAQSAPASSYAVNAGVLLSRPPQITRDLHPFEAAFFLYQKRLNERLALPFTRYFYVKPRTPADREWKRKMAARLTPARDIGRYKGYGDDAWNDEVLVGARESELQWQVDRLLEDAQTTGAEGDANAAAAAAAAAAKPEVDAFERPPSRVTEADEKNDTKSLARALQRTLYLLVKNKEGRWEFPQDRLGDENLHGAAQRILNTSAGANMNTWLVGHVPVGHYTSTYSAPLSRAGLHEQGSKTFFLKARIMAGQASLADSKLGLRDFQWLHKEELQRAVEPDYWRQVKNMIAER
ncbi:uncharacterized protein M421DRAFT_102969 [Didymella exigua CBS 183.55]|uniref:Large ribosomal subunit protein mL46 n=1 Tax=Didymella exigua CBS 183.55 TaxID=1150837 RepID=A0A6A5RDV5_9PLEO|nr:uncharacterized protein M421DRAFT_102969 [Didymella exigua CBS 183.55]KAF1925633.1 hypothetical protein M421DRAFT_102969 [Didymella exigua CBS 183.55]